MTDDEYDYRRIIPRGTTLVECGASGDCLFQSFAYGLGDRSGTLHLDLRQLAMEHLSANLADHEETVFTLSDDNNPLNAQTFINEMSIPGTHGNELCVQLLANVTERRVRVFSRHFDNDALGGFYTYDPLIHVPEHDPTIDILHLDLGDGVGHYQCISKIMPNPRQFQNQKITQTDSTNSNDSNIIVEQPPVPNFIHTSNEIYNRKSNMTDDYKVTIIVEPSSVPNFIPASPEIDKRRQKRQNLSPEQKEALNEKRRCKDREKRSAAKKEEDKLRKKTCRKEESDEATAARREKVKLLMKRCREKESNEATAARREKDKLTKKRCREEESNEATAARQQKVKLLMKRCREEESNEATAARQQKVKLLMKRCRQEESNEATAARQQKVKLLMKRCRQEESNEATAARRTKDKQAKKIKRQCNSQGNNDYNNKEANIVIQRLMKEAKHILHRTKDPDNPCRFKANVCIICDGFIIGTEKICKLTPDQISQHRRRLSVKAYESYYGHELKPELRKQYKVSNKNLKDLLLSPRSRKYKDGYVTCERCAIAMRSNLIKKITPPKFAIANGFVIGSFPSEIEFVNKEGETVKRKIEENELTDILKAMMAPVRMYGYVFAYSGGSQKSIQGNFQFFEMDQNKIGAVMTHLNQAGIGEHIYVVLCGRMTPEQKQIVRTKAIVNTKLFLDILTWFVTKSGHKGYENITIPEKCPQPVFIEDREKNNNTDQSVDRNMESNIESGTYHFTSAQEPNQDTSVFNCPDRFAIALLQKKRPVLLVSGGTFANIQETNIENVLPFSFPFGLGGTNMKRQVKVSDLLCIQHYMRLSLGQFLESQTILLLYQMYNRIKSFINGVMTCRKNVNGISLGDRISNMSMKDIEQIKDDKTDHLNSTTKEFLKAINTSSSAMGHTPEAAKYARRDAYAMLNHFGMNGLFLTTTPDDECNMRVQIYSRPQNWVSSYLCAIFKFRK